MATIGNKLDELFGDAKKGMIRAKERAHQVRQAEKLGKKVKQSLPIMANEAEGDETGEQPKKAEKEVSVKKDDDGTDAEIRKALKIDEEEGVPEYDSVVEVLNSIRAGRSLKDEEINTSFEEYYNDLSDAEKIAMYKYFAGTSEILSGSVEADEATEPSDSDVAKVSTSVTTPENTKSVEPAVVTKKQQVTKPKDTDEEDDSAPVPITVTKK